MKKRVLLIAASALLGLGVFSSIGPILNSTNPVVVKAEEKSLTLSTGNFSNGVITWQNDDISFTQEKGTGSTAPNSSYINTTRWYQNNLITVTPKNGATITKLVFVCGNSDYATALKNSAWSLGSATVSSTTVTWTGEASTAFTITPGAQTRVNSIKYELKATTIPDTPVTPDPGDDTPTLPVEDGAMTSFEAISGDYDSNVSYIAEQGNAGTAPVVNSGEIRIYQNGGLFTVTAKGEAKLNKVTIGSSMATSINYYLDGSTTEALSSDASLGANARYTVENLDNTSVKFICKGTDKSSRIYLNYLHVEYTVATEDGEKTIAYVDGGETNTNPTVYTPGTALPLSNPIKEGYRFDGWTMNGVDGYVTSIPATSDQNVTLTGHWTEHAWHKFINTETMASLKFSYIQGTEEVPLPSGTQYVKVDDISELSVNDKIVIASNGYAISTTQNNNNRASVEVSSNNGILDTAENVQIITLEAGINPGEFALKVDDKYLGATGTTKNYLHSIDQIDETSSWTLTSSDGYFRCIAEGTSNRNELLFNFGNSPKLFSCYAKDTPVGNETNYRRLEIYKETELPSGGTTIVDTYDISSVGIRFGCTFPKTLYTELSAFGYTSVSYGVAISKGTWDASTSTKLQCSNVAEVEANVQYYAVINNIPKERWADVLSAKVYVLINGAEYHYSSGDAKSVSVKSLANQYLTDYSSDEAVIAHNNAIKELAK